MRLDADMVRAGASSSRRGNVQALKRAIRRAGLDGSWRFHDLQHFFVTQLFRRGGSAPAVQALAGHLHLTTTQIYAHVAKADLRNTIELLAG